MIGGLILGAGAGRRFGGAKQLATVGGELLVERAVRQMASVGELDDVVLVLGADAELIARTASLDGARVVTCPDWSEGQAASLRCGIAALGDVDGVLVTLVDQPFVGAAAIERVLRARRPGSVAVRATYDGVAGHPVLLERDVLPAVLALRGDVGARAVLAGADVVGVPCEDVAEPADVDTPDDLAELRARADAR